MAKILVFDRDNLHPDPIKDRQGSYKTGDVVYVGEDSHEYSALEQAPPFRIVTLPGPAADYQYLRASEPAQLRDYYPRCFLRVARQLAPMIRNDIVQPGGGSRRRRWYRIESDGSITQKPIERD